jgi:hypothetical protein
MGGTNVLTGAKQHVITFGMLKAPTNTINFEKSQVGPLNVFFFFLL